MTKTEISQLSNQELLYFFHVYGILTNEKNSKSFNRSIELMCKEFQKRGFGVNAEALYEEIMGF